MTNQILAVLKYNALKKALKQNAQKDLSNLTWENSAQKCLKIYQQLLN